MTNILELAFKAMHIVTVYIPLSTNTNNVLDKLYKIISELQNSPIILIMPFSGQFSLYCLMRG